MEQPPISELASAGCLVGTHLTGPSSLAAG